MKADFPINSSKRAGRAALIAGGLAAILASTCCLGPLLLIMVGISGAWIGNLTLLAPYRFVFIGAALLALFFAWKSIWRPTETCDPAKVCAAPKVKRTYKVLFGVVVALVIVALGFPAIAPWFY